MGLNPADGVPSVPALAQMFIGEGRERFLKRLEIARQSQAASSQEFDIRRPDGIVRTVQIETEVVHGPLGEPLKLIGIYRDVTEMRALERQRDAFEIQLRQSQKLEALGTLAGGIAHDLNNALVPVVGLVQSVMKRVPPDSPERERLALIEAGSQRARDLVRRIVTFARKDEPNRKPIDIGAVVSNALKLLRASTPSTITIEERLSMMPPVHADEGQIVQVVTNLVTNSAQAIGEDMGTIAVEVSEVARSALASHAPAVRLTVADTGCGMDEATRARVRSVFHHQGSGRRNRAGAFGRARHRHRSRRGDLAHQRGRSGNPRSNRSAGRGGRRDRGRSGMSMGRRPKRGNRRAANAVVMALAMLTLPVVSRAATPEEAKALSERAAAYIKEVGEDRAFADFTRPDGGFVDGELYVFCYDQQGVNKAHGGNPSFVGRNLLHMKDTDGKEPNLLIVRKGFDEGEGWVDFKWPNPVSKKIESKSAYVIRTGDVVCGAGYYRG